MTSRTLKAIFRATAGGMLLCIALSLAGCTSEPNSDTVQLYRILNSVLFDKPPTITLQQAAAIPYATMGVQIGSSAEATTVLAATSPGSQLWLAGHALALQTNYGRISRTAGLPSNLTAVTPQSGNPHWPLRPLLSSRQVEKFLYDFADLNLYSVPVTCIFSDDGPQNAEILGKAIPTRKFEEHCNADSLGWSFVNLYWVGTDSGLVWKSVQHIHPKYDSIRTEVLRPPSGR